MEISQSLSGVCNIWFIVECGFEKQSAHTRDPVYAAKVGIFGAENNLKVGAVEIEKKKKMQTNDKKIILPYKQVSSLVPVTSPVELIAR